jgi:hypothetical protein
MELYRIKCLIFMNLCKIVVLYLSHFHKFKYTNNMHISMFRYQIIFSFLLDCLPSYKCLILMTFCSSTDNTSYTPSVEVVFLNFMNLQQRTS